MLWHQISTGDLLLVTLRKGEALVSPSTRTRDLALGPSLFHWERQSTTTAASNSPGAAAGAAAATLLHWGGRLAIGSGA